MKIFKIWAKASCTLRACLHCKTDDTKHRRVQMSFMLTQQQENTS